MPGKSIRCQPSSPLLSSTVKGLGGCSAPWFFSHRAKEGRRRDNSDVFYYTQMIIPQGRIAKFGYREISNHGTWSMVLVNGVLWGRKTLEAGVVGGMRSHGASLLLVAGQRRDLHLAPSLSQPRDLFSKATENSMCAVWIRLYMWIAVVLLSYHSRCKRSVFI